MEEMEKNQNVVEQIDDKAEETTATKYGRISLDDLDSYNTIFGGGNSDFI